MFDLILTFLGFIKDLICITIFENICYLIGDFVDFVDPEKRKQKKKKKE